MQSLGIVSIDKDNRSDEEYRLYLTIKSVHIGSELPRKNWGKCRYKTNSGSLLYPQSISSVQHFPISVAPPENYRVNIRSA